MWGRLLARPVFPFKTRLRWLVSNRFKHMTEALRRHPPGLTAKGTRLLHNRLGHIDRWNLVRFVVLLLLYFAAIATAASFILSLLPRMVDAQSVLQRTAAIMSAIGGLFPLLYLLLTRILGKLETDVLLCLHVYAPPPEDS